MFRILRQSPIATMATAPALLVSALVLGLGLPAVPAHAAEFKLHSIQYPERKTVDLGFAREARAPEATMRGQVTYRDGQASIEIVFDDMKPAVLYGGDVTCYVLWAVTLSGGTENLGELIVQEPKGKLEFSTGKKEFALLVTAEPYYLVSQPSDMVIFHNLKNIERRIVSTPFDFAGLGPAPNHAMKGIAMISWDSKVSLELVQAQKAHELAERNDAAKHAPRVFGEASEALAKANQLAEKNPRGRQTLDYARRSVAMSNEAINMAVHRQQGLELERQVKQRRAEMTSLEERAAAAESNLVEVRRTAETARAQQEQLTADIQTLVSQRQELESAMKELRKEKSQLRSEKDQLATEKVQLYGKLEEALSHVAQTRDSARGFVVNLPDILFDVNQATLKAQAQVALAKLAGITLILPDLTLTIEGHTDSTGSAERNQVLSQERATAVLTFMAEQGVDVSRLRAAGFGMDQPVAGNDTAEGRSKNRRVEIVVADSKAGQG